jgi:hypothetical protein
MKINVNVEFHKYNVTNQSDVMSSHGKIC